MLSTEFRVVESQSPTTQVDLEATSLLTAGMARIHTKDIGRNREPHPAVTSALDDRKAVLPCLVSSTADVNFSNRGLCFWLSDFETDLRITSIDDLVERDDFELERRGKDALNRVQSGRITKSYNSGGLGGYQPTQGRDGRDSHEKYWQTPGTPPSRDFSPGRSLSSGPMSGVSGQSSGRMSGVQYHK
jgi:hypothetical protein